MGFKDDKIVSLELINPDLHERMEFFLLQDIFNEEEIPVILDNQTYFLNPRYRDFKLVDNQGFPGGYPVERVKFIDGYAPAISIRAMHRIACEDLYTDKIHFMFSKFLKWKLFEYDNIHGSMIKFTIHEKQVPAKYMITYQDVNNNFYNLFTIHFECIWNLDKEAGFLVYYMDPNAAVIRTIYLDRTNVKEGTLHINILEDIPTLQRKEHPNNDET